MAGTAVDTALFPLDTLKTRMQSKAGFAASGGFRGVYSGLTTAVIGSAPGGKSKNTKSSSQLDAGSTHAPTRSDNEN